VNALVIALSRAVRRAPAVVLIVAVVLTAAIGAVGFPRIEQGGGNEGFSPDNPELLAQQRVQEVFGSSGDVVLQVLLRADEGGDVISAAGVQATLGIQQAIQASEAGQYLVQRPDQPPLISPLLGVLQAAGAQGIDPTALDDATVDQLFAASLAQMPSEQAGFVTGLLPASAGIDAATPVEQPESPLALAIIFLDSEALPADDIESAEVVQDISAIIEDVEVDGITLEPFAFELLFANQDSFTDEIGRLFAMAIGIILLILGFVYFSKPQADGSWFTSMRRTVADVATTIAVIMMAIIWVQGFAGILGPQGLGWIDALAEPAQLLPVLLVGLGVDYGIHMTSRYRSEVAEGSVPDAIGTATKTVGVALVLATVTTAVGFLTNLTAPVPALADFGVLAAVGIVAAFVLMLTVFPSLRLLLDRRAEANGTLPRQTLSSNSEGLLPRMMAGVSVFAERLAVPTLIVTAGIGGVLGVIGLMNVSTEFSFTDFLPEDDPLIVTFDTLTEEFGGGAGETTTVVIDGTMTPEAHNALVAAQQEMAGVADVQVFGENAQAASPVTVLAQVLASLQPADQVAPGAGLATPVDPALAQQIAGMLEPGGLTVPAGTDVEALYDLLLQAAPDVAGQVIAAQDDVVRVSVSTAAGEERAVALGENLDAVFAPVEAELGGDSVVVTSDGIISSRIVTSLRDSQLRSLFIAVLAAMVLLVLNFWVTERRPMLGVVTIAPVALVVLWTFGMMAATGVPVGPVTATIAALAVGIGVPYTIHVSHRFSEDRERFATAEEAIRSTVSHTGGALAGSAMTTIAGFGILVTSSLVPFQQFGLVTVYSIGFALIASTVVLPAMLVLYDRSRRRREGDPTPPAAGPTDGGDTDAWWTQPPAPETAVSGG